MIKIDVSEESVDNSIFYNKLSHIFRFFKELEKEELCCSTNSFLNKFMWYHYKSVKDRKEYRKVYEELSYKLINFLSIENSIFDASYNALLKENEKGRNLKNFRNNHTSKNYDLTGKKVFLEITYGGFDEKRYARAYKKMIEKRGAKVLDILLVRRRYILSSDAKKDVINWAQKIARSII